MNYKSLFEIVNADENILWNILSKVEKIVFVALTFKLLSSLNSRLLVDVKNECSKVGKKEGKYSKPTSEIVKNILLSGVWKMIW